MKRFLSSILAFIILLSLVPAAAFADVSELPAQEQAEATEITTTPQPTATPEATVVPEAAAAPEITAVPETTAAHEATQISAPPEKPSASVEPAALSEEDNSITLAAVVPVQITIDYNYDSLTEERVCVAGSNYNYVYSDTGAKFNALKDPQRLGYIFLGWYDKAEGGSEVSRSYMLTEEDDGNFTMYAHWEKGITVHFEGNGYKTAIGDKTVAPDKVYSSLPYMSSYYYPSNKAFDGWYTDEALTTAISASTDFSGLDEVTLYAKWRNYQYIVKFSIKYSDKNSVTGSMADVPVDFGTDYIIPECGYSREDYDFAGWGESSYSNAVKYLPGDVLNREFIEDDWDGSEDGESFYLYAIWKEDDFSSAFKAIKAALPADGCIKSAGALNLPASGDGWSAEYSSSSEFFSNGSILSLPDAGTQELTITAAVTKGGAVKTRDYKLTVYSAEAADTEEALKEAAAALPSNLLPEYGTDTNVIDMLKPRIDDSKIELSLKDGVTGSNCAIAADGTIDYYFSDSMYGGPGYVNFTAVLCLNGQSMEKSLRATIPWNHDKVRAALELAADRVIIPTEVTDSLELTQYAFSEGKSPADGYSYSTLDTWCKVTWASADSSVIKIGSAPYYPYYSPYKTTVTPGKLDQDITLTATLVCNSVDGVSVTKDFTVCVKGNPDTQDITELLQEKLDAGLEDPGLTDDVTGKKIDLSNITSSGIRFPTTRDFKIDGKYYPVTIKSSNVDVIKTFDVNNAARVEVLRPMPGEDPVKVTVTVTITEKATGKFASRDIELTVQPLVNEEIDRELALMELVKAHYFDGIRNTNTSPENIKTDLRAFQEAYLNDDGKLVWVYDYKDVTGSGIAPSEMDGWQAAEQWRLFRSSNPKVITHENLLVTRDKEHKLVTITSWLSSERFAELAKKYPDDKRLSQLINQPVSIQLQVTGTAPTSDQPVEELSTVSFTLSDNGSDWFSCTLEKLPEGTSALDVLHKALASHGYFAFGETYISGISGPNGVLKEKDRGPSSGWMYSVNGSVASVMMNQYYVSDGDSVEMFYTDDYTKLGHSGEYTPEETIDLIDAIGTVTKRSGDKIAAARKAYDSLTDEEKKLVTNYRTLLAAERAYAAAIRNAAKKLLDIYKTTGDYIETLPGGELNAFGSEWYIFGLVRSGRKVSNDYYTAIEKYVSENIDEAGRIDEKRATENAKLVLVLSALGKDVTNAGGHDLLKALSDMDYVTQQGLSGAIYTLLAVDCFDYEIPAAAKSTAQTSREGLIQYIFDKQLKDGGWAYSGNKAEPDMTAMALQALAAYYETDAKVKDAVDKAIVCLSELQNTTGGYDSYGNINSESAAQVIVALTALGIDPDNDARFVKNGVSVLDSLCSFYVEGGGFRHTSNGELDPTATAQGYYALAAYYRFLESGAALFDMTDLTVPARAA